MYVSYSVFTSRLITSFTNLQSMYPSSLCAAFTHFSESNKSHIMYAFRGLWSCTASMTDDFAGLAEALTRVEGTCDIVLLSLALGAIVKSCNLLCFN